MARQTQKRFTPLGVDHVEFLCWNRSFWQKKLERFGFSTVEPRHVYDMPRHDAIALEHGKVRVVLTDPASFRKSNPDWEELTRNELKRRGDMQVVSAAILVDDVEAAVKEYRNASTGTYVDEDFWGLARKCVVVSDVGAMASRWQLVQRYPRLGEPGTKAPMPPWKSTGVDHFAIGVDNLERWEKFYYSLGLETIYAPPHDKIRGEHSGMKTAALQRGGWVVALVEGVDLALPSQVSTYVTAHGNHSIQHAALGFTYLGETVRELHSRGARFRLRRKPDELRGDLTDIIHEGEDHSGPLYQCFTKPFAVHNGMGGFFFELIQRKRTGKTKKVDAGKAAFHDPTVIGLYESIELEELAGDTDLIFPEIES